MILLEDSIRIPPRATDFDEFRKWTTSGGFPENGRIDFLAGNIDIDMSPEELHTHGVVKTALSAKLHDWIVEGDLGEVFSDRARVVSPEAELSVEPDVVVVLWPSLTSGRVRYVPSIKDPERSYEIEGAPDLIVEIVSDSSVSKDTRRLPRLYARAGVPELWLADARGGKLRFVIHSLGSDGTYAPTTPDVDGWRLSPVLGCQARLRREKTRAGTWRYRLEREPLPPQK